MTIASWLLALLTAINSSSGGASFDPVLLDFHAHWCGPCRQVRPAVEELIENGYPVRSIDIDKAADLVERYGVQAVPTFIVVDASGRELDRTSGPHPAAALARFYLSARAKARPSAPGSSNDSADPRSGRRTRTRASDSDGDRDGAGDRDETPTDPRSRARFDVPEDRPEREAGPTETVFSNPHPAETVVRIRVQGAHSTGFGSGTIVHSTPQEALIVTCAHIFKLEGRSQPSSPRAFPRAIMIDLFDGKLRGTRPAQVHFLETVKGEALDYDFNRDVGLIRIRPGRRLPASRVVPAHWEPRRPMKMLTVGCSEGQDATAWYTIIENPRMRGFLQGNQQYEAIECRFAPKQGRSGGGLFTTDGYLAGVCNFAEPQGGHGLYATPRSIYALLDRNRLAALYAPVMPGSGPLLAEERTPSRPQRSVTPIARTQSPDPDEGASNRAIVAQGDVMIPPPSHLGIPDPLAARGDRQDQAASGTARRVAWQPTPRTAAPTAARSAGPAQPTDLNLDPSADHDSFGPPPERWQTEGRGAEGEEGSRGSQPVPAMTSPAKSRWRPVKAAPSERTLATPVE